MSEPTQTPGLDNVKAAPIYPLIEFPEEVDLNDFYVRVRVAMVVAHVYSKKKLCFFNYQELDDSRP